MSVIYHMTGDFHKAVIQGNTWVQWLRWFRHLPPLLTSLKSVYPQPSAKRMEEYSLWLFSVISQIERDNLKMLLKNILDWTWSSQQKTLNSINISQIWRRYSSDGIKTQLQFKIHYLTFLILSIIFVFHKPIIFLFEFGILDVKLIFWGTSKLLPRVRRILLSLICKPLCYLLIS